MIIKFNEPDEFIEELKKEPLAKPLVRVTGVRLSNPNSPLKSYQVVATAKTADGDIIHMEHYCGALWGHDPEDEKVRQHAKEVDNQLRKACAELKLEVRVGIFEP